MNKKIEKKSRFQFWLKLFSVLLAISIVLLATYFVFSSITKKSIVNSLDPIVSEFKSIPGATNVDVKINASPDDYFMMPWELTHHIFLSVEFSDLSHLGREKMFEILNDGQSGDGAWVYGYGSASSKYAICRRHIKDAAFNINHPVLVTLTDGYKSYTLKGSIGRSTEIVMSDAYEELGSNSLHYVTIILIFTTVALAVICLLIVLPAIFRKNYKIAESDKKLRGSKNKLIIIMSVVILFVLVTVCIVCKIITQSKQYNQAISLMDTGYEAEAYGMLKKLDGFKDSDEICSEYNYKKAIDSLDAGRSGTAYYYFRQVSGYKDADERAENLLDEYPLLSIFNSKPGECIVLGEYEQDNNTENGAEEIEWIVIKNDKGVVFAVSKYILDSKQYNTAVGEGSTLKCWLKDDFSNVAFDKIPNGFVSKVGLLTRDDVILYKEVVNTKAEWTSYATACRHNGFSWWLDEKYSSNREFHEVQMAIVSESGSYSNLVSDVTSFIGVRPIIIIDVVSTGIDYYAGDYSDINNAGSSIISGEDIVIGEITGHNGICNWCGGDGVTHELHGDRRRCLRCGGDGWIDQNN